MERNDMQHQRRVMIFAFSIEHMGTIELDGFSSKLESYRQRFVDLDESELRL
jgi:hypothetical protein